MRQITVGFSRSSGIFPIFSWLIMLFQWNNFSHSYMKLNLDNINEQVVFQASGLAVNFMGVILFSQKETAVKEFNLQISDMAFTNIMKSAIDLVGQPYSMLQIINSLIYLVLKKSPLDKQITGWDCSKLIAYELKNELNLNIPEDLDVITPKDLCGYLENIYGST